MTENENGTEANTKHFYVGSNGIDLDKNTIVVKESANVKESSD
jgi:hypothetical protein